MDAINVFQSAQRPEGRCDGWTRYRNTVSQGFNPRNGLKAVATAE